MYIQNYIIPEEELREQCRQDHISVIVVAAAITRYGMLFLARRAPGVFMEAEYELPGGYVGENETLEMAIMREVTEEVGLYVTQILGMIDGFDYEYKGQKVRQYNFVIKESGEPIRLDPSEHDHYIFVTRDSSNEFHLTPEIKIAVKSFFTFMEDAKQHGFNVS
jgi:8-oxo-dGTP diphosphatase